MDEADENEPVKCPVSWRPSGPPFYLFYTKSCSLKFVVLDDVVSKSRLEAIIRNYGGTVCQDAVHPSAIVLVPEETKPLPHWGPVFSRQWLMDSINSNSLKELNHYLIKDSGKINISQYNGSLTTSLFFDKFRFRDSFLHSAFFTKVVPKSTPYKYDDDFRIICGSCHCSINVPNEARANNKTSMYLNKKNITDQEKNNQSNSSRISKSNEAVNIANKKEVNKTIWKKRRLPFHSKLDFNDLFEEDSVCEKDKPGPSNNNQDNSREIDNPNHAKKQKIVQLSVKSPEISNQTQPENSNNIDKPDLSEKNQLDANKNRCNAENTKLEHNDINTLRNKNPVPEPSRVPVIEDSDDELPDLRNLNNLNKFRIVDKHSKTKYDRIEKEAILRFIVGRKAFHRLKSDALYREMEERNVCPRRTYQSMKNHFLKTLVHELDTFSFLTDDLKIKLRGH